MLNEKYSIALTVYNDQNEILELLNSIVRQNFCPTEIVIADGGSRDNTVSIIETYAHRTQIPIKVFKGKWNIAQGLNYAIKQCSEDIIGIVATGNKYPEDYFKILYRDMMKYTLDVTYSLVKGIDSTEFSKKYNDIFLNHNKGKDFGVATNHGVLARKTIFEVNDFFYESFVYAGEDEEFYNRVKKRGAKIKCAHSTATYWDTPHNLAEFKKQIKNYTIAKMQIYPFKEFTQQYKLLVILTAISVLVGCLFLYRGTRFFSIIIFCILFISACVYYYMKYKDKEKIAIVILHTFFPLLCVMRYNKYLKKQYKVIR